MNHIFNISNDICLHCWAKRDAWKTIWKRCSFIRIHLLFLINSHYNDGLTRRIQRKYHRQHQHLRRSHQPLSPLHQRQTKMEKTNQYAAQRNQKGNHAAGGRHPWLARFSGQQLCGLYQELQKENGETRGWYIEEGKRRIFFGSSKSTHHSDSRRKEGKCQARTL